MRTALTRVGRAIAFTPQGRVAMGAVAVGYGVYKGARWLMDRSDPKPIEELRMLQYGVLKSETDRIAIIRNFEREIKDDIVEQYSRATITRSATEMLTEYGENFEIDMKDSDQCTRWVRWYEDRFLPIFAKHQTTANYGDLDDPNDIEDQNNISKIEYIKRVTTDNLDSCYRIFSSPFGDGAIRVEPLTVKSLREALINRYGTEEKPDENLKGLGLAKGVVTDITKKMKKKETESKVSKEEPIKEEGGLKDSGVAKISANLFRKQRVEAFRGEKVTRDDRPVGLIEKLRMLQYGINPNDDNQLQPIRYLEKFLLKKTGGSGRKLFDIDPFVALSFTREVFPKDITDKMFYYAFHSWFHSRFKRVFRKYLGFMETEKINDLFNLEKVIENDKLHPLLSAVKHKPTQDGTRYYTDIIPFGDYRTKVLPSLIEDFENYLWSIDKTSTVEKDILGFTMPKLKDGIKAKTYKERGFPQVYKKQSVEANINEMVQERLPVVATPLQTKFDYPAAIPEQKKGADIEIIPPINAKVSSEFGLRKNPFGKKSKYHKGVDFAAPEGTPIKAAADGKIIRKDYSNSYGKVIYLQHKNNTVTKYAHMVSFNEQLNKNDEVKAGDIIGYVGTTGQSTGNHLHFELRGGTKVEDEAYDPIAYIKNGPMLAANEPEIVVKSPTDKKAPVGGVDDEIIEAPINQSLMEDYNEIMPKNVEIQQKQRVKTIEAQRVMENRKQLERLGEINGVLKNSLKVQINMSEYLQLIHGIY